jgi:hypothetical protein
MHLIGTNIEGAPQREQIRRFPDRDDQGIQQIRFRHVQGIFIHKRWQMATNLRETP